MALSVPANAGFLAVETTAPKTVIIPLSTDLVGRVITIKDKSGSASTNPITLSLQGIDTFENGATSYVINENFGSATIVSRNGVWLFQQTSQVSLANWANYQAVSSIILNGFQPNIINPSPIAAAVFQTNTLLISDEFYTPTGLNLGYLTFQVSTSQDSYTFINDIVATNTVSSLSLLHASANETGSLYLSSLYLGNLGGSIYGQLTTDNTATNIYWKGTQLNGAVGAVTTAELVSTVVNFQTDFKTQKISSGNIQISTVNLLDIYTNDINFLTVSTGTLLLNGGYITGSGGSAVSQLIAGNGISLAPPGGTGAVTITNTIDTTGLVSTSYLTTQLVSTTIGLQNFASSFIDTTELVSTVAGLGQAGYISSTQLTSTTVGTFDYVSSYFSTYIRNVPIIYSGETLYLNYSVSGPVSPYKQLSSSNIIGPSYSNIFAVPLNSVNNFVVGFQTDFALPSFIPTGLWTASLFCQAADTTVSVYATLYLRDSLGTETVIGSSSNSPFIVPTTKVRLDMVLDAPYTDIPSGGSVVLKFFVNNTKNQIVNFTSFFEDGNYSYLRTTLGVLIAQPIINSTVAGLGQAGYVSTSQLVSTVIGLGTAGYVSTSMLTGLVSTQNLLNLVSTSYLQTQLVSTVAGLNSVAVTQIVAGSNITISPTSGIGAVTINGTAGGLTTIPANLSTSAFFTSSVLASTISARSISTGFITLSSATLFDPLNANTGNSLAVASTFLYFNTYVIGGTRVAQQQWVVF